MYILGTSNKRKRSNLSNQSTSSTISTDYIQSVVDRLQTQGGNRNSTKRNYYMIWTNFNKFLVRLDRRPNEWEDRVALYAAYLVELGRQSANNQILCICNQICLEI